MKASSKSGVTLLELAIALTILALIAVNVTMVSTTGSRVTRNGTFLTALNDEADMTLDRIMLALMSSSYEDLYPKLQAPMSTSEVTYSVSLGLEGGEIVYGPVERIKWVETLTGGRVIWFQSPESPDERSVVWSSGVPVNHAGEIINGIDDNDNLMSDERGLAFIVDGELVGIHLTVERESPDGHMVPATRRKNVKCRN